MRLFTFLYVYFSKLLSLATNNENYRKFHKVICNGQTATFSSKSFRFLIANCFCDGVNEITLLPS
ncbi:hypothetical protein O3M35_008130 [Rhynocoris fuscipes]|uniref:Secreted protein n=1 Tax=Rhynocoris fuscipes TaxID=488301 RepID=A0AAW1DB15_9HEMI